MVVAVAARTESEDKIFGPAELSEIYNQYKDPATGWWPSKFLLKLHEATEAVYSHILRKGGDALDLGAGGGRHALVMRRYIDPYTQRVIAVEANSELISELKEIREVKHLNGVSVISRAIAPEKRETITFRQSQRYKHLGSIDPTYFSTHFPELAHDANLHDVIVGAVEVDAIIRDWRLHPAFIRFDLCGVDLNVICSSIRPFQARAAMTFAFNRHSPFMKATWQHLEVHKYAVYDCFMNRLTDETFFSPEVSPIERVALPEELDLRPTIIDSVREVWNKYSNSVSSFAR